MALVHVNWLTCCLMHFPPTPSCFFPFIVAISPVRRLRIAACERTVRDALHERNVFFRKLRSKPRLTDEDIKARFEFAKLYKNKTKAWWLKTLHLIIDLKRFQCFVNGPGRDFAAQRQIRGAYRKPGEGLDQGFVASPKAQKYNPGAKSALIAVGVGGGKVRLWTEISGVWNGGAAETLYQGDLLKSLKKAYPGKVRFTVLEDNDPTGLPTLLQCACGTVKASSNKIVFSARDPGLS
jgi:hypothetical protein